MARLIALALLVVAACGDVSREQHDAAVVHDAAIDTSQPPPPIDASPDAAPPKEAREFVSGSARMMSATYTFEIQVGHDAQQGKIAGPTYKLEGNAAVKP